MHLGSAEMLVWYLGTALELAFVVCSIARRSFFTYFFLNVYMLLSVLADIARWQVLRIDGFNSDRYMECYYYTDALLTVLLYVLLISLYSRVFGELRFAKHMKLAAVVLLLGTAGFSYAVVAEQGNRLAHFFDAVSQREKAARAGAQHSNFVCQVCVQHQIQVLDFAG